MKRIKGMIVAPFTGFTADGEVDLSKVRLQKQFYKDNGAAGAFVCGTTGEGSALTMQERKLLFSEWAKYKDPDFTLIAFLGGTSVKECHELALYARECGLDAVALTAPYYQKPANVHDLCNFCAEVASAVPDMPFYYYHIPCLNGVNFPMYDLLKEMDARIPNLGGIKYTYETMMDYQLCLNFKDRKYDILWGRDEMLLPALAIGAQAYVGSTYGYHAPVYNEIVRLFNEGRITEAAELQLTANRFIELLGKYGNGCGKAFMKAAGLDLGPCRAPLHTLSDKEYASLLDDLSRLPFEDYRNKFKQDTSNSTAQI